MNHKAAKGLLLDVGCRDRKEENWVGIDDRDRPGVDIVHDLEKFPYPIKAESVLTIKAAHIVEHISPKRVLQWFDEMWRMLLPGGQMALSAPYPGSKGYWGDPTHVTGISEVTLPLLDPDYALYLKYEPKPWKIEHSSWKLDGDIEAILRKRKTDLCYHLAYESIKKGAMQKLVELHSLYNLLHNRNLAVVVEIGTATGGVFWGLCQLARGNATLISIDLPGGDFGPNFAMIHTENMKQVKNFRKEGQEIHCLWKKSQHPETVAMVKKILRGRPVDFLLIDGDHTYEGVKRDYELYSPFVRKNGGIIAFHDISEHPIMPTCQVKKFWDQVKKGKRTAEFIEQEHKDWGGIGVILT